MPLLHHSIIVDTLDVEGLNLDLVKNGDKNNWTFNSKPGTGPAGESTPPAPLHLEFSGLTLKDATVAYNDLKGKAQYRVEHFNFKIKADSNGTISFQQEQETATLKNVEFELSEIIKGKINLALVGFDQPKYKGNLDISEFSVPKLLNKINQPQKGLDKPLFTAIAFSTDFSGDSSDLKLDNTQFQFGSTTKGTMNLAVNNFSKPQYSGAINLPEFSLNSVLDELNIDKSGRVNNKMLDKLNFSSKFSGTPTGISLQQFKFNFPTLLSGNGNIKIQNLAEPSYNGDISLPTFSLNQVLAQSGMTAINIPNKNLLNSVNYQSNFSGTSNNINLTQITAKISDSSVTGSMNVSSITPLKFTQDLAISKIELSDLTDTNGYKIPLTGVHTKGSISMNKTISSLNANQNISANDVTVLGFNLNSFIGQMDSALTSTGKAVSLDNVEQISNSVQVANAVKNMQSIAAKAAAPGQKDLSQKTDLGSLTASTIITNGIANPSAFKLSGPSIKSSGSGSVNLVQKTINYSINTQLIAPQHNDVLNHIIFPYSVKGSIDKMQGNLDWISIQKQLVEYLITNTTKQVKSLLKNQVNSVVNQQIPNDTTGVKQGVTNVINSIFK